MRLNRPISIGFLSVLILMCGAATLSFAQTANPSPDVPVAGTADQVFEEEKPVKPRIRRGSKIVLNTPQEPAMPIDGFQASSSVIELRRHLTRMAELEHIGQLAKQNKDVTLSARVNELLRLERKRYKYVVKRIKRYTQMKTQVGVP